MTALADALFANRLRRPALTGYTCTCQFKLSGDLVNWSHLTNSGPNSAAPGEILVMDQLPGDEGSRFYRARGL